MRAAVCTEDAGPYTQQHCHSRPQSQLDLVCSATPNQVPGPSDSIVCCTWPHLQVQQWPSGGVQGVVKVGGHAHAACMCGAWGQAWSKQCVCIITHLASPPSPRGCVQIWVHALLYPLHKGYHSMLTEHMLQCVHPQKLFGEAYVTSK